MKKTAILILLSVGLALSACGPAQTPTPIIVTQLVVATVVPSNTPTPTFTPSPVPTKTYTPTPTQTDTPIPPPTLTAMAAGAIRTQAALDRGSTATSIAVGRTATAEVKAATATYMAQFEEINWRDLVTYPDKYIGKFLKVRGSIFNIIDETDFQIWVGGGAEAVYVSMMDPYSDLYEGHYVTVYGFGSGEACGTNAYGGEICQPLITGVFYTK